MTWTGELDACKGKGKDAEARIRTATGFLPLPPQDSVSTNSTTSASRRFAGGRTAAQWSTDQGVVPWSAGAAGRPDSASGNPWAGDACWFLRASSWIMLRVRCASSGNRFRPMTISM